LEFEKDSIACSAASPIGRAMMLVRMYVETLKTDVIISLA